MKEADMLTDMLSNKNVFLHFLDKCKQLYSNTFFNIWNGNKDSDGIFYFIYVYLDYLNWIWYNCMHILYKNLTYFVLSI